MNFIKRPTDPAGITGVNPATRHMQGVGESKIQIRLERKTQGDTQKTETRYLRNSVKDMLKILKKNLEASRKWKANNKDKIKAYAQKHLADLCKATLKWAKKNPLYRAINEQNRRSRKRQTGGSITKEEWQEVLNKYGNKCLYPGCNRTDVTMDHVVPIDRGGRHEKDNVQPLCKHHNSSKGTRTIDYR